MQTQNPIIYKLFRDNEWQDFCKNGETQGAPIDLADGYIHFSTAEQVAETAAKYFAEVNPLHLLAISTENMGSGLKWETSRGGALFPHLYDMTLKQDHVIWAKIVERDAQGVANFEGLEK